MRHTRAATNVSRIHRDRVYVAVKFIATKRRAVRVYYAPRMFIPNNPRRLTRANICARTAEKGRPGETEQQITGKQINARHARRSMGKGTRTRGIVSRREREGEREREPFLPRLSIPRYRHPPRVVVDALAVRQREERKDSPTHASNSSVVRRGGCN